MPMISITLSSLPRPTSRRLATGGRFLRKYTPRRTRLPLVNKETDMTPLEGLIMGSTSDWDTLQHAATKLEQLGVPFETRIQTAHRTPDLLYNNSEAAARRGLVLLLADVDGFPAPHALATAQDRFTEKTLFRKLGIATPAFCPVDSRGELRTALVEGGLPAVLKTRTLGYDGKGQAVLRTMADVEAAWTRLGGVSLIVEAFVPFEREVSIIAVRGRDAEPAINPLPENAP